MNTRFAFCKLTVLSMGFCGLLGMQTVVVADPVQLESGPLSGAVEQGKKLFETEKFGGNGKTCNSCHPNSGQSGSVLPDGRKVPSLSNAATIFPRFHPRFEKVFTLSDQIRHCIREIKGTPPEYGSVELSAIDVFVSSLSEGKPVDLGGRPQ